MAKPTGLEKVPRILKKPIWTDRLFWWGIVAVLFWAGLFYWLFA